MGPCVFHPGRRQFLRGGLALAGLSLSAACGMAPWPWQPSSNGAKPSRIGLLGGSPASPRSEALKAAFRQGLLDLDYVDGQDFLIEERRANGDDQLAEPAAELVRLRPKAIVVTADVVARAVQEASATIPIVSVGTGDLVASGLVASLARPGGNITGLSTPWL